jgi:hypothetical protein
MQQINVKLWRNEGEHRWSVEIDGKSYEHISMEAIKELVKRALLNAQESMTGETTTHATDCSL